MKKLILLVCMVSFTSIAGAATAAKDRLAWSLLYGYAKNTNDFDYSPAGSSYKLMFGGRFTNFDINAFIRYATMEGDITFQSKEGTIEANTLTAGLQLGYWIFPWFNLHAGYARHSVSETVKGDYTSAQMTSLNTTYDIYDQKTGGIFGGADLVLLQSNSVQLFVNYEHYRINMVAAKEWEAMAGFRFYIDSKSGGSSENFFTKMFKQMFTPSK